VSRWWLGFGVSVALIVTGVVFTIRNIGSDGGGELSIPHGPTIKTGSTAALALLLGVVGGGWSLQQLGRDSPRDTTNRPVPTATQAAAKPRPKAPGQIFMDGFDGSELGPLWQPIAGRWRVADGVLHGAPTTDDLFSDKFAWGVLTLDRDLPSSYSLSLRVRLDDRDAVAELMIHLTHNGYVRAYLYGIDQDVVLGHGNGTFLRGDVQPGTLDPEQVQAALGGGESVVQRPFPLRPGVWYRMTVGVTPRRYRIRVSGIDVIDYTDRAKSLPASGGLGLIATRAIAFDDLEIRE
jgi:hypothetical protein